MQCSIITKVEKFYPRTRLARSLFRAPLLLWRLGFGPILGRFMLVLSTTGRRTGLPRHALVEYHVVNGRKYAPSGFGAAAQYYQNIVADPHVTIQTAYGTEHALAVRVSDDAELLAVFEEIQRADPAVLLDTYFRSLGIAPTPGDVLANKDRIYLLRFDPLQQAVVPGLEVDLAWLWPAGFLAWAVLRRVRSRFLGL